VVNGISLILTIIGLLLATKPYFLMKTLSHIFGQSIISSTNETSTNISSATATSPYYYIGVIFAFISSLTKAIQMIARKKLVATKQPYSVMNFQFTSVGLIVVSMYSIIRRFWQPSSYPWKWMFTVGVVIGCFQLITNTFYAKALKRENVQLLSILGTLDILYACLLQYIFFRLTKSWIFYLGALFIVISAILLSIDSHSMHKKQRKEQLMNENQKTNI
jgi:drug/metabolite transporter (DMT)-like permease